MCADMVSMQGAGGCSKVAATLVDSGICYMNSQYMQILHDAQRLPKRLRTTWCGSGPRKVSRGS